jgi:hypothetical protein
MVIGYTVPFVYPPTGKPVIVTKVLLETEPWQVHPATLWPLMPPLLLLSIMYSTNKKQGVMM